MSLKKSLSTLLSRSKKALRWSLVDDVPVLFNPDPEGQKTTESEQKEDEKVSEASDYETTSQKSNIFRNEEVEQIYTNNPCFCEYPLAESVACISSSEFIWCITNEVYCIFRFVLLTFATNRLQESRATNTPVSLEDKSWKDWGAMHRATLLTLILVHAVEFFITCLLFYSASKRIRLFCKLWLVCIIPIMISEVIIVIVDHIPATYLSVCFHPCRIYFIYIVWAYLQELKIFRNIPPIPLVRIIKKDGDPSGPPVYVPILIAARGWGYYPHQYRSIDFGFYDPNHPFFKDPPPRKIKRTTTNAPPPSPAPRDSEIVQTEVNAEMHEKAAAADDDISEGPKEPQEPTTRPSSTPSPNNSNSESNITNYFDLFEL